MEVNKTKEYVLNGAEIREALYDYFIKKQAQGIFEPKHIEILVLSDEPDDFPEIQAKLILKDSIML